MAPTTLVGQTSSTSPYGRDPKFAGYPIHVSEMLATLKAPRYIERTSLNNVANLTRTKRAIKKALDMQNKGEGFTFIEVLATCPTNWGLDPNEAIDWMESHLMPEFPLGVFRDVTGDGGEVMTYEIVLAGFGGQGILFLGKMIAHGRHAGGQGSVLDPVLRPRDARRDGQLLGRRVGPADWHAGRQPPERARGDEPAVAREVRAEDAGRRAPADQQDADRDPAHQRTDIDVTYAEITGLAGDLGNPRLANVVALGALIGRVGLVGRGAVVEALTKELAGKKAALLELNLKALDAGQQAVSVTA